MLAQCDNGINQLHLIEEHFKHKSNRFGSTITPVVTPKYLHDLVLVFDKNWTHLS